MELIALAGIIMILTSLICWKYLNTQKIESDLRIAKVHCRLAQLEVKKLKKLIEKNIDNQEPSN